MSHLRRQPDIARDAPCHVDLGGPLRRQSISRGFDRLFGRIFADRHGPSRLTLNFGGVSDLIGCMQMIAECL
jgi:hypothetical protein